MPGSPSPLVLLIDDDEDSRFLYNHFLTSSAGFRVEEASDGYQGVERAAALLPSVIVVDMSLPGIDGWETLARLRADTRTQGIPVVCLTGHKLESARRGDHAFDDVLTKPCLPTTLAEHCSTLLARR